jgi:cytosine/adenosine deaminase-related metal-dependent hydrolase
MKREQSVPATSYRGRWVLPVDQPPIAGGIVAVCDGRIIQVGGRVGGPIEDLGDVALLPGFVNAHTHLDLSAAQRPATPGSFTDWLESVVRFRRSQAAVGPAIAAGFEQLIPSGTTWVADVVACPIDSAALYPFGLRVIAYSEVVGLRPERYGPLWEAATKRLSFGADAAEPSIRFGISPHAPYSTSPEIYRRANWLPAGVPLATHWFETPDELELLYSGGGPLGEFVKRLGALPESGGISTYPTSGHAMDALLFGPGPARWILVHGNYLSPGDIELLGSSERRQHMAGVVYCPRTHAWFRHAPHPWRRLQSAGIPVALGTDSLASNPDLSVFEEARFLAANERGADPRQLIEMLTLNGATVLGIADVAGSLSVGRPADIAVVYTPVTRHENPFESVLGPEARVIGTMVAGRWLGRLEL